MTLFEKIVSVTFAVIVLMVSVGFIFTLGGVLDPDFGSNIMNSINDGVFFSKVLFFASVVLMIVALKEIFFGKKVQKEGRDGIILENETGKLIISKESLESLIAGEGKEIDGAESISSKTFFDQDKNLIVDVNVVVNRDVHIKEISSELQKRIKDVLKRTADLETKNINIRIKNISNKKSKKSVDANENKEKDVKSKKEEE